MEDHMGLFDMFKSKGALSNQQAPTRFVADAAGGLQFNPAYDEFITQQSDIKNMDTGRKMMMLGQAMQGRDVSGDMDNYSTGIRDRYRNRSQDLMNRRMDNQNLKSAEQQYSHNAYMNPLLRSSQTLNNNAQELLNFHNARNNPITRQLNQENVTAQTQQNAFNKSNNPQLLENQRLQNAANKFNNMQDMVRAPIEAEANRLANAVAEQQIDQNTMEMGKPFWVGNSTSGRLVTYASDGSMTDVTDTYPKSIVNAFKAQAQGDKTIVLNPATQQPINKSQEQADIAYVKAAEKQRPESLANNIAVLNQIAARLSTQQSGDETGLSLGTPISSFVRLIDPEGDMGLRALADDKSLDTQQIVAGIIQQNLRETLGAQFTQREGFLLIQRAYDVKLSPVQNSKRLAAAAGLAEAYLKAQQKKAAYYRKYQTLAGYDANDEDMLAQAEARVRSIYGENGGEATSSNNSGTPSATGTSSSGVSWSVSSSQ